MNMLDSLRADRAKDGRLVLRTYYEGLVFATFVNLWRRKIMIFAVASGALFLGILLSFSLPTRYTADAFMRVSLASSENGGGNGGGTIVSVDASLLVETRSRVFKTHQLARRVVDQVGLDRLSLEVAEGTLSSYLRSLFGRGLTKGYREDFVAATLLRNLNVKAETRAYLITVSYSARDPETAALIANAFVAAALKFSRLQRLYEQRAIAQAALFEQMTTLGERHPNVTRARLRLEGAEALLEAEKHDRTPGELQSTTTESIIAAEPVAVPSSPNPPFIIGVALILGLMAGVGSAVLVDRYNLPSKIRIPVGGEVTPTSDKPALAFQRAPMGIAQPAECAIKTIGRPLTPAFLFFRFMMAIVLASFILSLSVVPASARQLLTTNGLHAGSGADMPNNRSLKRPAEVRT